MVTASDAVVGIAPVLPILSILKSLLFSAHAAERSALATLPVVLRKASHFHLLPLSAAGTWPNDGPAN